MDQQTNEETAEATRQSSLSWQARQDVVDYLRGRSEPVIAETKTAAAAIVASQTGVGITAKQLWYLIEQLPKLDLGRKFVIGGSADPSILYGDLQAVKQDIARLNEMAQTISGRMGAIEETESADVGKLVQGVTSLASTVDSLAGRLIALEQWAERASQPAPGSMTSPIPAFTRVQRADDQA